MTGVELSTIVKNYTLSASTLLMGGWAFWKWGFSEWLRRRQEVPAVDGEISSVFAVLPDEKKRLMTIEAVWRNKSKYPVYIDTRETRIDVFQLETLTEGPIYTNKDLGEPSQIMHPYSDMKGFVLEPNTDATLQHHFVLSMEKLYLIRWKLYRDSVRHEGGRYAWTKEMVIQPDG